LGEYISHYTNYLHIARLCLDTLFVRRLKKHLVLPLSPTTAFSSRYQPSLSKIRYEAGCINLIVLVDESTWQPTFSFYFLYCFMWTAALSATFLQSPPQACVNFLWPYCFW